MILLLPVALLGLAGAITIGAGLTNIRLGRVAVALGAWAAIAVLVATWWTLRPVGELVLGPLGFGARLDVRLDAVSLAFGLVILVPAALLLTVQERRWQEAAAAVFAVAAALAAVESGNLLMTAVAGGTAATLVVIQLDIEDLKAPRPAWGGLLAAWLALGGAGILLDVRGGTAVFGAVPSSALTNQIFALIVLAGLTASGLVPWRGWTSVLWDRGSLRAAGIALATSLPLGFYLLVRAYDLGAGHYPSVWFNTGLSVLGVLIAIAAAVRAQAAPTRRDHSAEIVPGLAGLALVSLALGTPLGLAAGLTLVASAALLGGCLPLLPDRSTRASLLVVAVAAGLPPGLPFAARVLGLQATFESADLAGFLGVAAAAAWVLTVVAAARSFGLPAGRGHAATETNTKVAAVLGFVMLAAGPALAAFEVAVARPVAQAVMAVPAGALSGGPSSVVSDAATISSVALFTPLLVIGLALYLVSRPPHLGSGADAPVFKIPFGGWLVAARRRLALISVPAEYRSLVDFARLESATAKGPPILWMAALVALAIAVLR